MIEAGAPSTEVVAALGMVCASHRGHTWSHHQRPRATQRGRKAKAAPGSTKRGQGQYKGRSLLAMMEAPTL